MHDTIAIDFGTMRTKLSYVDLQRGSVELMRLGQDERPFIPSLFFLGEDGRRLYGDDAAEHLDSEPLSFLPRPLKRELREQWVRAGNRVKATPAELLSLLFSGLRERTKEIPRFREALPNGLSLTIPAQYGPPDRDILATSAQNAGFAKDKISFVDEPIAAAQAWLSEVGGEEKYIVVLDCGGGTLDWACLRRNASNMFEVIPELPPGGDNRVGGLDIDEAICAYVADELEDKDSRATLQETICLVREQIRNIKEKYCRTGGGGKIRVGGAVLEITPQTLEDIIVRRFTSQACQDLKSYLERVCELLKLEKPTVLLVGGSARVRGFQQAIAEQCKCNAVWWERSEYATVLGALNVPPSPKRSVPSVNTSHNIDSCPTNERNSHETPPGAEREPVIITYTDKKKEDAIARMPISEKSTFEKNKMYLGKDIPNDKIVNAWQAYSQSIPVSDVVLLHDATVFGNARKGLSASANIVSISAASNNKPWHGDWRSIRWLCLWKDSIGFDDSIYSLAGLKSAVLYSALDSIHALHRTNEFYEDEHLNRDICRSLLASQFLPITEVYLPALLGIMTLPESGSFDFANCSDKLLGTVAAEWLLPGKASLFLSCISDSRDKIRSELSILSKQYDSLSKGWQCIRSACKGKQSRDKTIKQSAVVISGIVGSIVLWNPGPGAAAVGIASRIKGSASAEPIEPAWRETCQAVSSFAQTWSSVLEDQVTTVEKTFGGITSLLEGVNYGLLYPKLAKTLRSEPLAKTPVSLELLHKLKYRSAENIQEVDPVWLMDKLMSGLKKP